MTESIILSERDIIHTTAVVATLLQWRASLEQVNGVGETPIAAAVRMGLVGVVK